MIFAQATSPFWNSILTATAGLVGVAVGGAITYLIERAKWQRDQRLDVYVSFLEAADAYWAALNRWVLGVVRTDNDKRFDDMTAAQEASRELFRAKTRLKFVASDELLDAADELHDVPQPISSAMLLWAARVAQHLQDPTSGEVEQPDLDMRAVMEGWAESRQRFLDEARNDL